MLYVGDHIFTDVNVAKRGLSWRTCMIMQELEAEVAGIKYGKERTNKLQRLYRQKDEQVSRQQPCMCMRKCMRMRMRKCKCMRMRMRTCMCGGWGEVGWKGTGRMSCNISYKTAATRVTVKSYKALPPAS